MKTSIPRPLLKLALVPLFLVLIIFVGSILYGIKDNQSQNTVIINHPEISSKILGIKTKKALPVRLIIPAVKVNAIVTSVGVNSNGEMEVPGKIADAGWFDLGPLPGERGSAVIAGHFYGEKGEKGVFVDLSKLKEGDKIYVEDSLGVSTEFVVRTQRLYDPGFADDVFSPNDSAYLNLITCDGVWDEEKKSYGKRLVVFADIVK